MTNEANSQICNNTCVSEKVTVLWKKRFLSHPFKIQLMARKSEKDSCE